jgi:hypothetical protein
MNNEIVKNYIQEEYTIFMYIYDEYKRFEKDFSDVNQFLANVRIRYIVEFYKQHVRHGSVPKPIHYEYYKKFTINMIDIIQMFYPCRYTPPYRLLLCKPQYEKYGVHRFGWKAVIQSFLSENYTEDCFRDRFYYQNPDFEWVSYAIKCKLNTCEQAESHYKNNTKMDTLNQHEYTALPFLIFDDWLELSFPYYNIDIPIKQYQYPFISFIHNPPCKRMKKRGFDISGNFLYTNKKVFKNEQFTKVKDNLGLLICLSNFHKTYLEDAMKTVFTNDSPSIHALYHPLQSSSFNRFNINEYLANPVRNIATMGWWLRKFDTFIHLENCEKTIVVKSEEGPHIEHYVYGQLLKSLPNDKTLTKKEDIEYYIKVIHNTSLLYNLSNQQYDNMINTHIVFLELYDTTANNLILECIMNNTPILVNPLPSIVEYLGADYPFYFSSLEESQMKIGSTETIVSAYKYLCTMDKTRFSYATFNRQLKKIICHHLYL